MRNMFTIFRREFATYFNSPIGYIYIIVFLLLNAFLFLTPFFINPRADMRPMFNLLPFILCVLIPLITMRLWAEDRKENTIEMLLTFPMHPHELVLGKYIASVVFFVVALLSTATIPIMLYWLGRPDLGAVLTSYIGAFFLGMLFLALGTFLSALVRDQIVAAVLALAACFGLYLAGTDFVAIPLDGWINGLGTFVKKILGVTPHYDSFARGILGMIDISYFLVWSILFLFLNGMYLEGRNRPGARAIFGTAVALCLVIGMFFSWLIADVSLGRVDCTEGKIHTVSEATKAILKRLNVPVQVTLYITPKEKMPTELKSLEQDIRDKLKEMSISSGKKLRYKIVHLEADNLLKSLEPVMGKKTPKSKKEQSKETVEKTLYDKGVTPVSVATFKRSQQSTKLIYSRIGIAYEGNKEEILPPILPQNLHDLEYQTAKAVNHLTHKRKPVVVLVAPKDEVPPHIARLLRQMNRPVPRSQDPYQTLEVVLKREKYEVKRVELSKKDPLPANYDALIIIAPKELSERQKWEIARAVRSGKNVLLAVQQYTFNYDIREGHLSIQKSEENPQVNDWLKNYGITIDQNQLLDENNVMLTISTNQLEMMFGGGRQLKLPNHVLVTPSNMNQDVSLTSRLEGFPYLWGTALTIDKEHVQRLGIKLTTLFTSSKRSWKIAKNAQLTNVDLEGVPSELDLMRLAVLSPHYIFLETSTSDKNLKKGPVPASLRQAFALHERRLSTTAKLEKKADDRWHLQDLRYLFSLDNTYQKQLDNATLAEALSAEFAKRQEELSGQTTLTVDKKGSRWLVNDKKNNRNYTIEKEQAALYIYDGDPKKAHDYLLAAIADSKLVVLHQDLLAKIEEQGKLSPSAFFSLGEKSWYIADKQQAVQLDAEVAASLNKAKLNAKIIEKFAKDSQLLNLSATAKVTVVTAGQRWLLTDKANNREYLLIHSGDKIYGYRHLLALAAKYSANLDQGEISSDMRSDFANAYETLALTATVTTLQKGRQWLIVSDDQRYWIEKDANGLRVFPYVRYLIRTEKHNHREYLFVYRQIAPAPFPLMVMLKGQFPDVYEGKSRPRWPKPERQPFSARNNDNTPEPPAQNITPLPANMMILGCANVFRKSFINKSFKLFLNCAETMALSGELIKIRSRQMIPRDIDNIENPTWWKFLNYGFMPLVFLVIGVLRMMLRHSRRVRYTLQMQD